MELVTVQDFFKSRRGSEPTVRPGSFDGAEVSKPPTALKKIARIVSLRSLGLGLKTTNGPGGLTLLFATDTDSID